MKDNRPYDEPRGGGAIVVLFGCLILMVILSALALNTFVMADRTYSCVSANGETAVEIDN